MRPTVLHSTPVWLAQTKTWLYNQVRRLPDEGVESHVVCEDVENLDQFWLPNIHSLSDGPRWRYLWDRGLRKARLRRYPSLIVREAKRQGAGVLHSHFGNAGWKDLSAARRAGLRHVVTFYGYDVNRLPESDPRWRGRYRELFARVDRVLCEGPHMARCIVKDLGCPEEKVRVHRLGVELGEIPFKPRVPPAAGEPLRVLIAASFQEKKGIPYALEALGRLQQEAPLEVTVIGDASAAPGSRAEKRRILEVIEKRGLGPKTRMLGFRPHAAVFEEAYHSHVFLSPSVTAADGDTEGGAPVGLIEMAASGMPVVSTRHCDIPEVVEDGVTGLLAEERDVEGLVERLGLLAERPEGWHDMLRAGRERVEARFDAATQAGALAEVYRDVLS